MDWRRWHEDYDDPESMLSTRLSVVRARLAEVLESLPDRDLRLLSLCAGEGRDVIPVLRAHRTAGRMRALLVELDDVLAARAQERAQGSGLSQLEVRCADAGDVASFDDFLPADVLLVCGILGNIDRDLVPGLVERLPAMVADGGFVIWTRGGRDGEDDPRSEVRRCFVGAGMVERSFDGPTDGYGVGVNQVERAGGRPLGEDRLFTFTR